MKSKKYLIITIILILAISLFVAQSKILAKNNKLAIITPTSAVYPGEGGGGIPSDEIDNFFSTISTYPSPVPTFTTEKNEIKSTSSPKAGLNAKPTSPSNTLYKTWAAWIEKEVQSIKSIFSFTR